MNPRPGYCVLLASVAAIAPTGCMSKMTIEDIKAMMPQRPPELDKLNPFVGRWESTGEARMAGLDRNLKYAGKNEVSWEGDRWYLVNREAGSIEKLGDIRGLGTWTYDVRSKKFRTTWINNMGTLETGIAWHDKNTDTWQMRTTSYGPYGRGSAKGTVRFTDPNTMEWTWAEYMMGGLIKTVEMTGTSTRR